ncbi:MAG: DUF58 domain-containing protein [Aggregatilineales bacterium]
MRHRRFTLYILTAMCLLAGLFTGRAIFFNIAFLMALVYVFALARALLAVRGLGISRNTRSRRSQVGRTFSEVFTVKNLSLFPRLWLEVRDHSTLPDHRASHIVPALGRNQQYQWRVDTLCTVRGEFLLGPITINSGDPFGLFSTPRRVNASERVIIYPRLIPITQFIVPMGNLSGGEAQRFMTHHVTTNAAGVREYVPGDSINRIHWKSTARRNKLIVKEFELDPMVDMWMLVDFSIKSLAEAASVRRAGRTGYVLPGHSGIPPSTEEYGVVVAASLAQYFIQLERALGFISYLPHREVYTPERGHRQFTRVMETLAVARSNSPMSLHEILTLESGNFSRGATLVIITSSVNLDWVIEAELLARRGIRPMCVFIDPAGFGGASGGDEVRSSLHNARIPTIHVQQGDDLTNVLAQKPL